MSKGYCRSALEWKKNVCAFCSSHVQKIRQTIATLLFLHFFPISRNFFLTTPLQLTTYNLHSRNGIPSTPPRSSKDHLFYPTHPHNPPFPHNPPPTILISINQNHYPNPNPNLQTHALHLNPPLPLNPPPPPTHPRIHKQPNRHPNRLPPTHPNPRFHKRRVNPGCPRRGFPRCLGAAFAEGRV